MSTLLTIIEAWEQFNKQYPTHSAEAFYAYAFAQQAESRSATVNTESKTEQASHLLRTIGRIGSAFAFYHRAAMAQTALPTPESFYYLNSLQLLGEARKTELISYLFAEYTTGMEAISRLLANHLIHERPDPTDGRAKLISLTKKGSDLLKASQALSTRAANIVLGQLSAADLAQCQQLLQPIEQRHSRLVGTMKGKDFEAMYTEVVKDQE